MHTPAGSVHLPTADSAPVSADNAAPHAAGGYKPPFSAALPETLDPALKTLQTSFHDSSNTLPKIAPGGHSVKINNPGTAAAGLPETPISDFGQQRSSDMELSGSVTNTGAALSLPRISGTSSMPPLRKASSQVSSREMDFNLEALPALPSPQLSHSWPPTAGSCAQLGLPADGMGAADADNPALQVRRLLPDSLNCC